MTVAFRQPPSLTEFLAWEERQEIKHEFDGVSPVAMVGGTVAHARIQAKLIRTLGNRLVGKPYEVFGSELRLKMARTLRYPDAMVVCTPLSGRATFVADPTLVFEIASTSTSRTPSSRVSAATGSAVCMAALMRFFRSSRSAWTCLSAKSTLALSSMILRLARILLRARL